MKSSRKISDYKSKQDAIKEVHHVFIEYHLSQFLIPVQLSHAQILETEIKNLIMYEILEGINNNSVSDNVGCVLQSCDACLAATKKSPLLDLNGG